MKDKFIIQITILLIFFFTNIQKNIFAESSFGDDIDFEDFVIEEEKPTIIYDPFENFNRKNYKFYAWLYKNTGYYFTTYVYKYKGPYVGSRLTSFKNNLNEPRNVINNLLQGKVNSALEGVLRFTINSSLGIFGLFDVMSYLGLESKPNDFGITFAFYNIPEGPFLMILGPFTLRDTLGLASNWGLSLSSGFNNINFNSSNTLTSPSLQNNFKLVASSVSIFEAAELYNTFSTALEQSLDEYNLIKYSLYKQRQQLLERTKKYN